ncbi:DegT/DnrJ/EryC1/StrS family aminotransferase [Cecembia lonarensis]|uniref:UDP-4-amino-4-deoxy-L-arabinose--oxoglutarate aminotransferase n=1 Tax=Cecembia lonarensis (strain CCUG 58316 / KCTC 22772 / LW9) TaxID=1225176 RepID=K1L9L7_CECL9|nr:DegT/DnrJ/EryC1/StrS family aminotransferase [Cecembia lonarensis]EKB48902.1 UDP-4-amino-4-deoxy-L-arabinose--oxoglutarate aminotransferase [Cecembia lonarensis LW9]
MIKFSDLQKINRPYAEELKAVAAEVIDSGRYLFGPKVLQLEQSLSEYLSVDHVVAVGNGLDALRLILQAYIEKGEFNKGDEVLLPANTYIATFLSIVHAGLVPVPVEPDFETFNLDFEKLEARIGGKTKAIVPVHLYGRVCWDGNLKGLAAKYNLKIIEDNAQAFGAEWLGQKTGALGHAAAFSFFPSKILGALGDAGAVATRDAELAQIIQSLANYGSKDKYQNLYKGVNSRMDEMQAAFLLVKLKYVDGENHWRRTLAKTYLEHIVHPEIILPHLSNVENDPSHVWHLFVVRSQDRDGLKAYLMDKDVQTLVHYPIPPHHQSAFKGLNHMSFPITERIHREVLSLPLDPSLSKESVQTVAAFVNGFKGC